MPVFLWWNFSCRVTFRITIHSWHTIHSSTFYHLALVYFNGLTVKWAEWAKSFLHLDQKLESFKYILAATLSLCPRGVWETCIWYMLLRTTQADYFYIVVYHYLTYSRSEFPKKSRLLLPFKWEGKWSQTSGPHCTSSQIQNCHSLHLGKYQ